MIDENTPLADHQSFSDYSATATEYSATATEYGDTWKQDVGVGKKATRIDRVFISVALLGTAAQPSLHGLYGIAANPKLTHRNISRSSR